MVERKITLRDVKNEIENLELQFKKFVDMWIALNQRRLNDEEEFRREIIKQNDEIIKQLRDIYSQLEGDEE